MPFSGRLITRYIVINENYVCKFVTCNFCLMITHRFCADSAIVVCRVSMSSIPLIAVASIENSRRCVAFSVL